MTILNGYCLLTELKAPERLNIAVTTYDASIEGVIEAISRAIDNHCGRRFYLDASDATRYFTAELGDELYPGDLVSVTTLATDDDGNRVYETVWVTTDFDLWPSNAVLDGEPYLTIQTTPQGNNTFPVGMKRGVKIIGKWGWPAVPKPVKEACILWSMRTYERYKTPLGVGATTALGEMQVKVPPPDPDVMMLLARYVPMV